MNHQLSSHFHFILRKQEETALLRGFFLHIPNRLVLGLAIRLVFVLVLLLILVLVLILVFVLVLLILVLVFRSLILVVHNT